MNLQNFSTSPREITQKVSTSYFPWVLSVILQLKCIIHQNFGKLNLWMKISFIILFMIRFIQRQTCACICGFANYFFKKLLRNH